MTAYDRWKTTDPDLEGPECPECGGIVEADDGSARCIDPGIFTTIDSEPCPHSEEEIDDEVCDCIVGCGWAASW